MRGAVKDSASWSKEAFMNLVWPEIKPLCRGDIRYTENSGHETDRNLDILAGIDAYTIVGEGIRGLAVRVQKANVSYDTFTLRYERHSAAGFETEYKKRLAAVRSNGDLLCAYLFVQAYVSNDLQKLHSVGVCRVRDLFEFAETERLSFTDEQFPRGERKTGCYLKTVVNDGAADFVVVPWAALERAGIRAEIRPPRTAHRRPSTTGAFAGGEKKTIAKAAARAAAKGETTAYPDAWEWACLPCNVTGRGDSSKHRCTSVEEWRQNYWARRLQWSLRGASNTDIAAILSQPIARTRIVELLGESWKSENDPQ